MSFFSESQLASNAMMEQQKFFFSFLPAYASFILDNHLEAYARMQLKNSREEKVPILKYFEHLPEEEITALAVKGSRDFLQCIAANKAADFIKQSTEDFVKNRLPSIEREQVVAGDITIGSFVRRKTLRSFLNVYTDSFELFLKIMEELDRFILESETASFNAYIGVQQHKINRINHEIEQRHTDLAEAQELAKMGSFIWDLQGDKSVLSAGILKIFELTEATNMEDFMQGVHKEDRPKVEAAINKAFTENGIYECEYRLIKNNREKKIWSRGLVTFSEGKPVYMKGTIMDVTNKYQLIEQLQQSEVLHKQAQAITHIGNWSWEIEADKITWSDEMYRIYGLEPQSEAITFHRFLSLIHPEDREKRIKEIQQALATHNADDYQMRIVNPDGIVKVLQGKGEVITGKNNVPLKLLGTCQDITREYTLNQELKEKEAYLKQLIDNAPDSVIVIDRHSRVTLWNPKTEQIFGWKAGEVIGKFLQDVIMTPEHREAHTAGLKRLMETKVSTMLNRTLELTAITKTGNEIDISLTISQSVQQGQTFFIVFLRDITRQKQIQAELKKKTGELKNLNKSLEQKNNELENINRELESFNYIASHDLKEPLRKIQLFTNRIMEDKEPLPQSAAGYFDKIMQSSSRMQLLIEDLLMYSQATDNDNTFEPVNLNLILDTVKAILFNSVEEANTVITAQVLPEIVAIPFQIQQLFLNLVSNSLKYAKEAVPPKINISSSIISGVMQDAPEVNGDTYLHIEFADNGIGFEEDNAERIFGLFTRLHNKDQYSGTGIGLAICKKIINNHKGIISAKSKPGNGAVFNIYLPEAMLLDKNI